MASSAANPDCPVTLYTPSPGEPHSVAHPMVQLPSHLSQPFSLLKTPDRDYYQVTATSHIADPRHIRFFATFFMSDPLSPVFTETFRVIEHGSGNLVFVAENLAGATNLWFGAWWDDGTYGNGNSSDVIRYFRDHPEGGIHHTVPIIIT